MLVILRSLKIKINSKDILIEKIIRQHREVSGVYIITFLTIALT